MDAVTTGQQMRRMRENLKLTVEAAADQLRLANGRAASKAYVSLLELGKATWTPVLVKRYEAALWEGAMVAKEKAQREAEAKAAKERAQQQRGEQKA